MIAVLVDKMIRTQIVDCAAVANWLFSQDMAHEFTRWDISKEEVLRAWRRLHTMGGQSLRGNRFLLPCSIFSIFFFNVQ